MWQNNYWMISRYILNNILLEFEISTSRPMTARLILQIWATYYSIALYTKKSFNNCIKWKYESPSSGSKFPCSRNIYLSAKWSDHISLVCQKLHWLPVSSRIQGLEVPTASAYSFDLILPDIRSEMGCISFSFAAPTIWNSFPQHIRFSDSLSPFHGLLKPFYIKMNNSKKTITNFLRTGSSAASCLHLSTLWIGIHCI